MGTHRALSCYDGSLRSDARLCACQDNHDFLPTPFVVPRSIFAAIQCDAISYRDLTAGSQPIAPLLPPGEEQVMSEETGAVSEGNGFGRLPTNVRDAAFDNRRTDPARL